MTRPEVEAKLRELVQRFKREIQAAPVQSFFAGVLLGVVLVVLRGLLLPLLIITALLVIAWWFFAEQTPRTPFSMSDQPPPPSMNDVPPPEPKDFGGNGGDI